MKKILSQIFLFLCVAALCASCEKDGDMAYVDGFEASDLIATATDLKLDVSQRSSIVLQLAWHNPTLLSSDETQPTPNNMLTTYVEVSGSEDFANSTQTEVSALTKAYTGTELNTLAKSLGIEVNTQGNLYFRIKSTLGSNITPAYSNVCKVAVTPYFVDMTRMAVLASNKTDTIAYLNSPTENGIYTGYMNATAWQNCYFYEYSGVTWGNYGVSGHPFELSSDDDKWNCWFADGNGHWYVTVDTQNLEWKAMLFTQLNVNGQAMTYYSKTQQWGYYITTTQANEQFTIDAIGHESGTKTGDGSYEEKEVKFVLNNGSMTQATSNTAATIATPGTYTIIVEPDANGNYVYRVVEGKVDFNAGDTPQVNFPSELIMTTTDGATDLATLAKTGTGIYTGTYTVKEAWENFKINDREGNVLYGSDPTDLYKLSSDAGCWSIWFDQNAAAGDVVTITVNLNTLTWSYSK